MPGLLAAVGLGVAWYPVQAFVSASLTTVGSGIKKERGQNQDCQDLSAKGKRGVRGKVCWSFELFVSNGQVTA